MFPLRASCSLLLRPGLVTGDAIARFTADFASETERKRKVLSQKIKNAGNFLTFADWRRTLGDCLSFSSP
jgi:hypothetical protein